MSKNDNNQKVGELNNFFDNQIKNHTRWAVLYILLIATFIVFGYFLKGSNVENWGIRYFIKYYLLILPIIAIDILLVSQFLKHTKLVDHYAYNKSVLKSLEYIKANEGNQSVYESTLFSSMYSRLLEYPPLNNNTKMMGKFKELEFKIQNTNNKSII